MINILRASMGKVNRMLKQMDKVTLRKNKIKYYKSNIWNRNKEWL